MTKQQQELALPDAPTPVLDLLTPAQRDMLAQVAEQSIQLGIVATQLARDLAGMEVETEEHYVAIMERLKESATTRARATELHAASIDFTNKLHKRALEMRDFYLKPLKLQDDEARVRAGRWYRAEEQRKAEVARQEQARRDREAEVERQLLLEEAEERGDMEVADVIREQPAQPAPPSAPPEPVAPKILGVAPPKVKQYRGRVVDEAAVPREFCSSDMKKIQGRINQLGAEAVIAGVVVDEVVPFRITS